MAIVFDKVTVDYGNVKPIDGMSFELPERGVCVITGESGSGKSTLLRLLSGLLQPTAGSVRGLDEYKLAYVFQEDRLLGWLSVLENLTFVNPDEEGALAWLRAMELDGFERAYPEELSGGMRRRVAIARAMHYGGSLLLLDEPFKGFDDELKLRIAERITGRFELTVIAAHSAQDVSMLAREGAVLTISVNGRREVAKASFKAT
ncbi:MAG: ATP-binding cassette domain-containing protein [Clostridia bacterium]|nr:ATP-binding cassette domain-containing protein [Clostridia bacterium]